MKVVSHDEGLKLQDFNEKVIFEAVKEHIKSSNFPKKIVLKKFDLLIENYSDKISKLKKLILLSSKTTKEHQQNVDVLSSKNRQELNDLTEKLS
jgi:hypothetical protein